MEQALASMRNIPDMWDTPELKIPLLLQTTDSMPQMVTPNDLLGGGGGGGTQFLPSTRLWLPSQFSDFSNSTRLHDIAPWFNRIFQEHGFQVIVRSAYYIFHKFVHNG